MKQNEIQHIDDLIIDEKNIKNVARKYQSQGGFIQNFCINKFGVMPLCYRSLLAKTMAKFLHEYTYKCCGLFSIKNKRATC